jgi:hypothetical protein
MKITNILLCESRLARSTRSNVEAMYILDNIHCPRLKTYHNTKKDMRDLATRLQHDEPEN